MVLGKKVLTFHAAGLMNYFCLDFSSFHPPRRWTVVYQRPVHPEVDQVSHLDLSASYYRPSTPDMSLYLFHY